MNNSINGKEDQKDQSQQPAQQNNRPEDDSRQQAIEQENDTARLRSERKSVEDGSSNPPGA